MYEVITVSETSFTSNKITIKRKLLDAVILVIKPTTK